MNTSDNTVPQTGSVQRVFFKSHLRVRLVVCEYRCDSAFPVFIKCKTNGPVYQEVCCHETLDLLLRKENF